MTELIMNRQVIEKTMVLEQIKGKLIVSCVIALPLQGMALKNGNSAFVDENWNAYEDQLKVLAGTKRLTRQEIEDYLSLWYSAGNIDETDGDDAPWEKNSEIDAGGCEGAMRHMS